MKSIVCSILFANLLTLGTLKPQPSLAGVGPNLSSEKSHDKSALPTKKSKPAPSQSLSGQPGTEPGGDTVIVKLKNKNKVLIITDKGKDLGSFKSIDINKILADVDSTLKRDSLLGDQELDVRLIRKDSTIKISKVAGDRSKMKSYKIVISTDDGKIVMEGNDTITRDVRIYTGKNYSNYSHTKNRIDDIFELDFGFNNYLENGSLPSDHNKDYGVDPWVSNYVALRGMKQIQLGKQSPYRLSIGLEFAWNNYKYDSKKIITKGTDGVTFESPTNPNWNVIKSKLTVNWLNFPVMFHYKAKKSGFHVAAGGFVGYRIGSHSKIKYEENGDTKKDHVYTNFYLDSFQYGTRFQIGFHDVDFFAQYNLNELFVGGKGPKLTPFVFGITL